MFDKAATYEALTSTRLTYEQKLVQLAKQAENGLDVLDIPPRTRHLMQTGAIHDLFEGHAPYRPRYTMPDYGLFMGQGSGFLNLAPPQSLDEALFALMILYRHVPSITSFPVYLGSLDKLLNPFLDGLSDQEIKKKLVLFCTYLDRTITDSFCHANIGPEDTRAGRLLLEVVATLRNAVPNLTLLYDPAITPDSLVEQAISASLVCSNPAICNHRANVDTYPCGYGISSCYNVLPLGGGGYTLTRLTLTRLVEDAKDIRHFLEELLPEGVACVGAYMNQRIRFLVEKSGFFQSSFLVQEGLLHQDRFLGMFGVTGLAEGVNALLKKRGLVYGRDEEANQLGLRILDTIQQQVGQLEAAYSPVYGGRFALHAQVGLDSDLGTTSGVRIPVGDEPEQFVDHLRHSGRYHRYFPAGVGDIFPIAGNVAQNPQALLDVVKGAFQEGMHYLSFYSVDTDLVRITGYLVKRSEMAKHQQGSPVLQNTTHLGAPNYTSNRLADRKVRMV